MASAEPGARRAARERALGLLYESEAKGVDAGQLLAELPLPPEPYSLEIVEGVSGAAAELDRIIAAHSLGWPTDRMPVVDLIILRIGAWELRSRSEVPVAVVLSEAVELAKRYSTGDSGRFVNGVLAALATELRDGEES